MWYEVSWSNDPKEWSKFIAGYAVGSISVLSLSPQPRRLRHCPSSLLFGVGANVGAAGLGLPPSKKSHEWNSTPPRSLCRSLPLSPSLQVTRSVFFKCYVLLLLRMDGAEERDTWPFEMVLTKDIVDLKRYLLLLSWVVGAWDQIRLGAKAKHPLAECTEIGKKAWLFAKLQPGRARKAINAT